MVAVGIWVLGRHAGAPSPAPDTAIGDTSDDLPVFDTPDLFSNVEGDGEDGSGREQPQSGSHAQQQQQQQPQSPYEAEIERLEQERALLEARQELEEQKAESMPPVLPEKMPKPVTEF